METQIGRDHKPNWRLPCHWSAPERSCPRQVVQTRGQAPRPLKPLFRRLRRTFRPLTHCFHNRNKTRPSVLPKLRSIGDAIVEIVRNSTPRIVAGQSVSLGYSPRLADRQFGNIDPPTTPLPKQPSTKQRADRESV